MKGGRWPLAFDAAPIPFKGHLDGLEIFVKPQRCIIKETRNEGKKVNRIGTASRKKAMGVVRPAIWKEIQGTSLTTFANGVIRCQDPTLPPVYSLFVSFFPRTDSSRIFRLGAPNKARGADRKPGIYLDVKRYPAAGSGAVCPPPRTPPPPPDTRSAPRLPSSPASPISSNRRPKID